MKVSLNLPLLLLLIFCIAFGCKLFSKMLAKNGTEFIVKIETSESDKESVIEKAISVIKNKLNSIKLDGEAVKDPDDANRIIVRIYGAQDLERQKKFLFTTYQLEFRKVISPPNPNPVQTYPTIDAAKAVATDGQEVLLYSERNDSTKRFVIVDNDVIVNGDDIRDAKAVSKAGSGSSNTIAFSLKPSAAVKFGEWTPKNIGNYLAIVLDKKIQSIAYIKGQIFDSGEINGRFTKEEAEDVALSLKSGYLPATMTIIEERHIGN